MFDYEMFEKRRNVLEATELEKLEAETMSARLDLRETFSYFGLLLGIFPPAAFFLNLLWLYDLISPNWLVFLFLVVNIITAFAGYFSGRLISRIVREIETYPWWAMIFVSPLIGIIWGIMAGAAGGLIVYLVGAIPGAILGGLVGGAAMPLFLILRRLLKKGEFIEIKYFLPIAVGIALTISAFILAFPHQN